MYKIWLGVPSWKHQKNTTLRTLMEENPCYHQGYWRILEATSMTRCCRFTRESYKLQRIPLSIQFYINKLMSNVNLTSGYQIFFTMSSTQFKNKYLCQHKIMSCKSQIKVTWCCVKYTDSKVMNLFKVEPLMIIQTQVWVASTPTMYPNICSTDLLNQVMKHSGLHSAKQAELTSFIKQSQV